MLFWLHVAYGLHTVKPEGNNTDQSGRSDSDTSSLESAMSGENGMGGLTAEDKARLQAEARKRRREKERQRENMLQVESTILAASSDQCDWKKSPLLLVKGQVCGIHYKVLSLDRNADKSDIKKAHRAKSLALHPDKNKAPEATTAFKLVSDAYECLVSLAHLDDAEHANDAVDSDIAILTSLPLFPNTPRSTTSVGRSMTMSLASPKSTSRYSE